MHTHWGELPVSDAHVHFLSHTFFEALAKQKPGLEGAHIPGLLGWDAPAANPEGLGDAWAAELGRHGVHRAVLIGSVPGEQRVVASAIAHHPDRFFGYCMIDPTQPDAPQQVAGALASNLHGICLFPAMHRYSMHDDRVGPVLDAAAERPGTVLFVHCGVLSVGVRKKLGLPSNFDMRFSNPIDLHAIALRYPQVPFVVPHFGAGYFREALMLCDLCPNVYLDTSSSNSWLRFEPEHISLNQVFKRTLEVAGARRLLFGTDSSFFPRGWHAAIFEAQSKALYEIGIKEQDAALIFDGNLTRLLRDRAL